MAGYFVYKKESCVCASSNICGYSERINEYIGVFILVCLGMNESIHSHGYSRDMDRLKRDKIMLSVNDAGNSDYEYMELYIKNLEYKK